MTRWRREASGIKGPRRQKRKLAASVRLALVVRHTPCARHYSLRRVGEIHLRAEQARISLLFDSEESPRLCQFARSETRVGCIVRCSFARVRSRSGDFDLGRNRGSVTGPRIASFRQKKSRSLTSAGYQPDGSNRRCQRCCDDFGCRQLS